MSQPPSQENKETMEAFNKAVELMNIVAPIMGSGSISSESNERYALFQQATRGNADDFKCDSVIPEEVARWELWKSKANLTKEDAMKKFVEMVAELEKKHMLSTPLFP